MMRIKCFLLVFIFSLTCYSQESLKIDFSIDKEKEALFIHIKNDSDTTFYIYNHLKKLHRVEEYEGSRVYISDRKKEYYNSDNEMYFPINSYTGEKWWYKKHFPCEIKAQKESIMDITGFRKELLAKDKVYVKLELIVDNKLTETKKRIKRIVVEQWVPVE